MRNCIAFFFTALIVFGCASKDEIQERQNNAFDLQGEYLCSKTGGCDSDLSIAVRNETGRHNVIVTVTRNPDFTSNELALFTRFVVDPTKVSDLWKKSITLGSGAQFEDTGGENISDDFGESSQLRVMSAAVQYDAVTSISFYLSARITKANFILDGVITTTVSKQVKKMDEQGKEVIVEERSGASIKILGKPRGGFVDQYFAGWSGNVYLKHDISTNETNLYSANRIQLSKVGDTVYKIAPALITVQYKGSTYNFVDEDFAIANLQNNPYPHVTYKYSSGSATLTFYGRIWNLGNFKGSVVHSTEGDIAGFEFKRN